MIWVTNFSLGNGIAMHFGCAEFEGAGHGWLGYFNLAIEVIVVIKVVSLHLFQLMFLVDLEYWP